MISFRMLTLAALTVYMLPTDPDRQRRFVETSERVMVWTATFCDRNQKVCATGNEAWAVMKAKASFGADVVYGLVMQNLGTRGHAQPQQGGGSRALERSLSDAAGRPGARGTLTPADLLPAWGGPARTARFE